MKSASKKAEHLQKVVLPEKRIWDSVHNEVNKLEELVEEYQNIKDDICMKVVHELEIQKYEDKILKLDQELELAKVSLVHYMQSAEAMKNMINSSSAREIEESPEVITLQAEVRKLQEQNMLLIENSRKLEEIYEGQINNVTRLLRVKNDFDVRLDSRMEELLVATHECKEALIGEEQERVSLTYEVGKLKESLRSGESFGKELRSIITNVNLKTKNKGLEARLQELVGEEVFMLRNQLERLEQQSTRTQKVKLVFLISIHCCSLWPKREDFYRKKLRNWSCSRITRLDSMRSYTELLWKKEARLKTLKVR